MNFSSFSLFLFLLTVLLTPPLISAQSCSKGRLTKYTIFSKENDIPQGTCNFGPAYASMPEEFKSYRIIAANQDYYNGFKTSLNFVDTCTPKNGTSCGLSCGQCVLVTGAKGSASFIIGDIGDYPTVGIEDGGDMTQFALNNYKSKGVSLVADAPGYELMTFRPIPCNTTGNIGFFYPEDGSNKWSVALTFYNHRVPIKKVEVKGNNPKAKNVYIELPRDWTNKFVWRGSQSYVGQSGDIYNGGDGFQVRVTSTFDEVIESQSNFSIPASKISSTYVDLGAQFKVSKFVEGPACKWSGPNSYIYNERVTPRKYNKSTKNYDTCTTGAPGCRTYLEGRFLVEWWLVYQIKFNLNLLYKGSDCQSQNCIQIKAARDGAVLILGFSSSFNVKSYGNVTFSAKMGPKTALNTSRIEVTFDGCNKTAVFIATQSWIKFSFGINTLSCPTYIKNLKFVFGGVEALYLDNIYLGNPNRDLIDPGVVSNAFVLQKQNLRRL